MPSFAAERFPNCDSCEATMINGVYCHESGCPNRHKRYVPERESWIRFIECRECGAEVEEGESCDCHSVEEEEDEADLV